MITFTQEQYEFLYEVIRELVTKELNKCDENFQDSSENLYENIAQVLKVRILLSLSLSHTLTLHGCSALFQWRRRLKSKKSGMLLNCWRNMKTRICKV